MKIDIRRIGRLLNRGIHLRCPRCGAPTLFRGAFSMYPACVNCELKFEREQGYFIGAIYINYGVTAIIMIAGYFWLDHLLQLSLARQLLLWSIFAVNFPLFFFRYARSLWLSIDYIFNPEESPGLPESPRRS